MPNYCQNYLTVFGSEDEIRSFIKQAKPIDNKNNTDLSLAQLYPEPSNPDEDKTYNWYDWRLSHWGTKWDIEAKEFMDEDQPEVIHYQFLSAWSPPIEWVKKVSANFPHLEFALIYMEAGMNYFGLLECVNGKVIRDQNENFKSQAMFHSFLNLGFDNYY